MADEPEDLPVPAFSRQQMAIVFWRVTQHNIGNPWAPDSVEEINPFGPPTSDLGFKNRVNLLVQLAVLHLPTVTALPTFARWQSLACLTRMKSCLRAWNASARESPRSSTVSRSG